VTEKQSDHASGEATANITYALRANFFEPELRPCARTRRRFRDPRVTVHLAAAVAAGVSPQHQPALACQRVQRAVSGVRVRPQVAGLRL